MDIDPSPEIAPGRSPSGRKGALLFLLGALLVLGAGLGGLHWLGQRQGHSPHSDAASPLVPPVRAEAGAYKSGGRPATEGPARAVFAEVIPSFVLALDAAHRANPAERGDAEAELERARLEVLVRARKADLDEATVVALEALLKACVDATHAQGSAEHKQASKLLLERSMAVNDELASRNQGFYLDPDLLHDGSEQSLILLFSFTVERVILYRSNGRDIRTLQLRRLDRLNRNYNLLGFTAPERRHALVLSDKVEERLIEFLPALADMDVDPFYFEKDDRHTAWYVPFRERAGQMIREELGKAGPVEPLARLGQLLARRHEIIDHWNDRVGRGVEISQPDSLELTWDYWTEMAGIATKSEMRELDEIQKELGSEVLLDAYAAAFDHYARSIERHEAQHRLDLGNDYALPMPEPLASFVGDLPDGYRGGTDLASSALAELSAYLSELARDPLTVRLNLANLSGFALNRNMWGSSECYAALVILEELARELELADVEPVVAERRIQQAAVAALFQRLSEVDEARLRASARSLWKRLFGVELPPLEIIAR